MGVIKDFKIKHTKRIIALDPGTSNRNGTGWVIGNSNAEYFGGSKNTPIFHCTGIVTPFSSEPLLPAIMELGDKIINIWRQVEGFSRSPLALVIELPMFFTNSVVNPNSIRDLTLFTASLLRGLNPKYIFLPNAPEWKGNKSKEETKASINKIIDYRSKSALQRDLLKYPTFKHHNIYDAIGLALYCGEVLSGGKKPPKLSHGGDLYQKKMKE